MIDIDTPVTCRQCGTPIKRVPGRRPRVYCKSSCRQKALRERKREQVAEHRDADTEAKGRIETLERENAELLRRVKDLQHRLQALSDVNERFRNDTRVRAFPTWLEKRAAYYAESPMGLRFLADRKKRLLPPSASRSEYERILRYTLKYSEDEIETFREAWREMLKTQF